MNPEMMIKRLAEIKAESQMIMEQLAGAGIPPEQALAAADQMSGGPQGGMPPGGMPPGGPPGPMPGGPMPGGPMPPMPGLLAG